MTPDLVRTARPHLCPECGEEYERVARHWGSGCPEPEIGSELRATLDGLALATASADGDTTTRLRLYTVDREAAEWAFDGLDWLAASIRRVEATNSQFGDRDQFRVDTVSHSGLDRYRKWGQDSSPPRSIDPSPGFWTAWWQFAGTLSRHKDETPHLQFRAESCDRLNYVATLFRRSGYPPRLGDGVLVLSPTETTAFLNVISL